MHMESYTTDSGGGQENIKRLTFRHTYGKLHHWLWRRSGKHKEAHFQACIWKAALDEEPPNLDPLEFEWIKDDLAKYLCAVSLLQDVPLAPAELLKMIQCMCSSDQPCSSLRCGCVSGQLPCSLFCKCGGTDSCCNQMIKNNMANDANDDEEPSDDEDDGDEDDD